MPSQSLGREKRSISREGEKKKVETAVVITTSGVIFINLQDLPLSRDQAEKGKVKLCQKRPEREEEEEGEREDRVSAQEILGEKK